MAHAARAPGDQAPGHRRRVFTLADIGPINILEAGPELAAHRHSPYPPLADDRVRYVGQTIAACVMPTRAQAEDLADQVEVELEELPAVVDVVAAMRPRQPARVRRVAEQRLHQHHRGRRQSGRRWPSAPVRLRRRLRLNRQATVSLEGRGVLAYWDHRLDELVVYLSTQGGQVKRHGALAHARTAGAQGARHRARCRRRLRRQEPDHAGGHRGRRDRA